MSKHTPGPWKAVRKEFHNGARFEIEHGSIGEIVATTDNDSPEQEADAILMAAAPELLEACQLMETAIATGEVTCDVLNGRFWTAKKLMLAAIAKATT